MNNFHKTCVLQTGYSYGFGFVNFTREEDAARAIETFNGYQLRNKRLKVELHVL